jgi:type II secretory pathway pseudopilin PulG
MAVVIVMVLIGVAALSVVVALAMRTVVREEQRTEDRLHAPGAHTVAYAVPNGQDPVDLMAALRGAGIVSCVDTRGGTERILVECAESDRDRVRDILQAVGAPDDGRHLPAQHVVFEDER